MAGTVRLVALLAATVLLIRGPVNTAPETAYAPRVELAPANTQRPVASVLPPTVGSPGVAFVSTPAARFAGRAAGVKPKPTSVSFKLKLVAPAPATLLTILSWYATLLRSLSGTLSCTKLFVLLGPNSPMLTTTASGLLAVPSVMTLPPELPVSVTAPPEVNSTKFDTVAVMVTEPVVCALQTAPPKESRVAKTRAQNRPFQDVDIVVFILLMGWGRLRSL